MLKTKDPGQMKQRTEKEREKEDYSLSWRDSRVMEPEIYLVLSPSYLAVELTFCVT